MKTATDRQQEVLAIVENSRARTGQAPTYSQIARELRITRQTAAAHVTALVKKNLVARDDGGRFESGRARFTLRAR